MRFGTRRHGLATVAVAGGLLVAILVGGDRAGRPAPPPTRPLATMTNDGYLTPTPTPYFDCSYVQGKMLTTDHGVGVFERPSPNATPVATLALGTTLAVVGPTVEAGGTDWWPVHDQTSDAAG